MLYSLPDIKQIHLELTDKCNAGCPQCPRYIDHGSKLNPYLPLDEITLDQFKKWFPRPIISNIERVYACGNYGDPIMARDTLEIFQYIRYNSPECGIAMHTNGSARSREWWTDLAKLMTCNIRTDATIFSIDGLEDTNHLYRRGTDFNKIINNAKIFIDAGGLAKWDFIVFRHNEHQVEDARQIAKELGFINFNVKRTTRWPMFDEDGLGMCPVRDKTGQITHYLRQPLNDSYQHDNVDTLKNTEIVSKIIISTGEYGPGPSVPDINEKSPFPVKFTEEEFTENRIKFHKKQIIKSTPENINDLVMPNEYYTYTQHDGKTNSQIKIDIRDVKICCRAQSFELGGAEPKCEIFVSSEGYVFPCCFLGGEPWKNETTPSDSYMRMLNMNGGIDTISLRTHSLPEIISNKVFSEYLPESFNLGSNARSKQCTACCGKDWNILDNGELGNEEVLAKNKRMSNG